MNRVFFVDGFHTASRALRLDHKQISTSIFRIRYFQMRGAHKECTLNTINHIFERAFGLLLIVYLMRVLLNSIYFSFFLHLSLNVRLLFIQIFFNCGPYWPCCHFIRYIFLPFLFVPAIDEEKNTKRNHIKSNQRNKSNKVEMVYVHTYLLDTVGMWMLMKQVNASHQHTQSSNNIHSFRRSNERDERTNDRKQPPQQQQQQ